MTGGEQDHEAVLARIAELEAANARLTAENDALRRQATELVELEPPYSHLVRLRDIGGLLIHLLVGSWW
jgi:hypothetical protein